MSPSTTATLRLGLLSFLPAFLVARIPGRILGIALAGSLPPADLDTLQGVVYFYGLAAVNIFIWALLTAVLFALLQKQKFDWVLAQKLVMFFVVTGLFVLYLGFEAGVDPRIGLVGLVANFLFGWYVAAKRSKISAAD